MVWVQDHLAAAAVLGKPMVLSEYGKGRPLDGTAGRHAYFEGWFNVMYGSSSSNGPAAGLHFWMMEADGSDHDDGFSVFPSETETLALLSGHAWAMNTLIAPVISGISPDAAGRPTLSWTPIVGQPDYEVQASTDLVSWVVADRVSTDRWTDLSAPACRFYRIRPYWTEGGGEGAPTSGDHRLKCRRIRAVGSEAP
jgi:hypothetical protein